MREFVLSLRWFHWLALFFGMTASTALFFFLLLFVYHDYITTTDEGK